MAKFAFNTLAAILLLSTAQCAWADDDEFKYPTAADYPTVRKVAAQPNDFVPKGWKIIGQATGDLNGDNAADTALVLQATAAKFKQENHFLGESIFDTNPRMLLILFKNNGNGFKLAEQGNTIIPIPDSPTMQEPFEKVAIKDGTLELNFAVWYSAGTWFSSNSLYKFKYLDNKFVLIGAEVKEIQRNSGQETSSSYNFYTHKLKTIITGGASEKPVSDNTDDDDKPRVRWLTIPNRKLRPLNSFKKLYEWQVIEGYSL